jgi:hypothetical protein
MLHLIAGFNNIQHILTYQSFWSHIHLIEKRELLAQSQEGARNCHHTDVGSSRPHPPPPPREHFTAAFCDLIQAFDSCNHEILLSKLSRLGICSASLNWFANYLSERSRFVCVNGVNSSMKTIQLGVP